MQVVVDDLLVSYSHQGNGQKTILCLHGWADSSETFKSLVAELKADYSFILVDLPGFGGSQSAGKAWSINDYAAFAQKFLNKINKKPKVIIGHSNGGAIAIYAVAHKLINAEKIILLASSGIRNKSLQKKKFYKILAKPAKLALMPLPKSTQHKIKKLAYQKIGSDMYAAEHMKETFKNIVNYDIQDEAKILSLPALLIYGGKDNDTPPEYGEILAGCIQQSKYEIIPNATHFLHQQQPEIIAAKIKKFVQ